MNETSRGEWERLGKLFASLRDSTTWWRFDQDVGGVLNYVLAHYSAPERHYHNLTHINDCLNGLYWMMPIEDPDAPERVRERKIAELALWYHDLVYDPKLHNNEELSVAILRDHSRELRLDVTLVDAACTAIMATRHKAMPTNDVDKLVVDLDLNILRTPPPRFDAYEREVREEYAFVDDASWIIGRTKVLKEFLDRDWIYSTPTYRRMFEGDARENIKRSLARLAKGEVLHLGLR